MGEIFIPVIYGETESVVNIQINNREGKYAAGMVADVFTDILHLNYLLMQKLVDLQLVNSESQIQNAALTST